MDGGVEGGEEVGGLWGMFLISLLVGGYKCGGGGCGGGGGEGRKKKIKG